jgi:hypothetical protein
MAVTDVKNAFTRISSDRKIDEAEVKTVLEAMGTVSVDEQKALKQAVDDFAPMMSGAAKAKFQEALGELSSLRRSAAATNHKVELAQGKLTDEVKQLLTPGADTKSFGGTKLPEAVKSVMNAQYAKGAVAYDVREVKTDPVYDTSHGEGELTIDGKYNPYSQNQKAVDSMAFGYTELTPQKIADDMNTVQKLEVLDGYKTVGGNQEAQFKQVSMKGNGRITELYDEASWSDTMARGPDGQKYASNFAVLADGSVHCVPASRRSKSQPNIILTTATLGRGKQMLFNGHLHMENGVVTYVGMSGRLCKLADKGTKFVDPVELLKAWGFKMTPGLTVTKEG